MSDTPRALLLSSSSRQTSRKDKDRKKNDRKYIGRKFEAIHRSRELAVQFLYSLDVVPDQDFDASLELFMNLDEVAQNDSPDIKERCRNLASEVHNRKSELDSLLLRIVTGWRPDRMVTVDRTILRLMILEGFVLKTLPVKAAITEAVKLANDFGTDDSPRFINGVMFRAEKFFESQAE